MTNRLLAAVAATCVAGSALASGAGEGHGGGTAYLGQSRMTYEIFETAVPHVDLSACPKEFDDNAVFCRLTLAQERAHVFVFSFDGDQPLLAVKSVELFEDTLRY